MALRSLRGLGSFSRVGKNPSPVYSNMISEPSSMGSGLKKPVSALVMASMSPVSTSNLNTLDTPV